MKRLGERAMGCVVSAIGCLLAFYSFPFATWIAFAMFNLGLMTALLGIWLMVRPPGTTS